MKKPAKSLPDTNAIVRYLVADDPALHEKAKEFFDKVKHVGVKAVILESVIAECIYVLTKLYKVPRDRAAGSLIDLLRFDFLPGLKAEDSPNQTLDPLRANTDSVRGCGRDMRHVPGLWADVDGLVFLQANRLTAG